MATSIQNAADAVNAALVRIGYRRQVGDLRDGSAAAQVAIATYGQVRDAMMRDGDWGFAQRSIILTEQSHAPEGGYVPPNIWSPDAPQLAFKYQYAYPDDCLKVRSIRPQLLFIPNFSPQPNVFSIANTDGVRVILTNVADAIAVYTGRITDPTMWAVDFTEAFIDGLGEALALALTQPQAAQLAAAEGKRDIAAAKMEQG